MNDLKRPDSAILLITLNCSLRCKICYLWTNNEDESLYPDYDELVRFIDDLDRWAKKPFTLIFGGGEPLLYKEKLAFLICYAKSKGFRTSLATSGYFLDLETVHKLSGAGLDYIALTLYSLDSDVQDFIRGVKGSLKKVKRAIKWLSKYTDIEIAVDTVLMGPNVDTIIPMTEWVLKNKAVSKISFQAIVQPFHTEPVEKWFYDKRYSFLWPDVGKVIGVIEKLKRLKSDNRFSQKISNTISQFDIFEEYFINPLKFIKHNGCPLFNNGHFGVNPDGGVTLCPYMKNVGNIKAQSISEIWESKESAIRRREISECSVNCHQIMNCWYEDEMPKEIREEHIIEVNSSFGDSMKSKNEPLEILSASSVKRGEPHFCDITITNSCMLKCKMCKAWQNDGSGPSLTYDECKSFVDQLAQFVGHRLEINVMGGEPLMVPWCLDLCGYISGKGFSSIISTNGYLIDEDMAKRISDSGLSVLAISLESLRPDMHDKNRNCRGLTDKVMRGLEYLDKHLRGTDTVVTILTIIMKENLRDIIPLVKWAENNSIINNISLLALLETGLVKKSPDWFKRGIYKELWPDAEALKAVISEVKRLRQIGYKVWNPLSQLDAFIEYYKDPELFMKNTAYSLHDYIIDLDEEKNIYLSGERLGVLGEKPVKDMWASQRADEIRKKIDKYGAGQRSCLINFVCAFPGDDEYDSGKIEVCDDYKKMPKYKEAGNEAEPKFAVMVINQACPLRCKICNSWALPPLENEVSIDELKKFVSQVSKIVTPPFEMNIAGGEPFMKKGIIDLIKYIRSFDFFLSVTTNAYMFSNDGFLREVLDSGLTTMPISLDSLNESVHDYIRGRKGAYAGVMKTFDRLIKDKGCLRSLTIQTIIMKNNLNELPDIVRWASKRGIAVFFMALMRPIGWDIDKYWFKDKRVREFWPDDIDNVKRVIDTLIDMKLKGFYIENKAEQLEAFKEYFKNPTVFVKDGPCSIGNGIINIGPTGDIFLCWEMPPIGNIRCDDIEKLWRSDTAAERRIEISRCRRNCAEMVNCFF